MSKNSVIKITFLTFILLSNATSHAAEINLAETSIHKNKSTGLLTWTAANEGFKIELIQLIPDLVRAIFEKHHFPKDEVERIAAYCVFGTILKNTSDQIVNYQVSEWRYQTKDGIKHPIKHKDQWLKEWRKAGIKFSWSLLPSAGEFAVGDWQQGLTTIKLPRNSKFDFIYKWHINGIAHTATLKNISCTAESLAENNLTEEKE